MVCNNKLIFGEIRTLKKIRVLSHSIMAVAHQLNFEVINKTFKMGLKDFRVKTVQWLIKATGLQYLCTNNFKILQVFH